MEKILVFDMDGTIADLYGCENWLDDIIARNERPYANAKPLCSMYVLNELLNIFKDYGWKIAITSWLAKNSTKAYDEKVIKAKTEWLNKYDFPYDIINIVDYGTKKTTCTENFGGYQILIDDEEPNRNNWNLGDTINPQTDLIGQLLEILTKEIG